MIPVHKSFQLVLISTPFLDVPGVLCDAIRSSGACGRKHVICPLVFSGPGFGVGSISFESTWLQQRCNVWRWVLNVSFFPQLAHSRYNMKHTTRTKWLAHPNGGRSYFPRHFRSLYECVVDYQSEDSCNGHIGSLKHVGCWFYNGYHILDT